MSLHITVIFEGSGLDQRGRTARKIARAFRAQRVNTYSRFEIGILAPVNEHFADSQILRHVRDNFVGMVFLQQFGRRERERLRLVVCNSGVQWLLNLNAF